MHGLSETFIARVVSYAPPVSDIGGSGNSGFDALFFRIEGASVALLIGLCVFSLIVARSSRFKLHAALCFSILVLAVLLTAAVPFYWNTAYPVTSGIEGAGRLMVGAPLSLLNAGLSALALLPLLSRGRRAIAVVPIAAAVLVWVPTLL